MSVIAKSAKTHPGAKKCYGQEEPAIYVSWTSTKNGLTYNKQAKISNFEQDFEMSNLDFASPCFSKLPYSLKDFGGLSESNRGTMFLIGLRLRLKFDNDRFTFLKIDLKICSKTGQEQLRYTVSLEEWQL